MVTTRRNDGFVTVITDPVVLYKLRINPGVQPERSIAIDRTHRRRIDLTRTRSATADDSKVDSE
jgi:hypothetical protein